MSFRDHKDILAFREAADRFCALLESPPSDADRWLEELLASLAKIYANAQALPDVDLGDSDSDLEREFDVTDDEWHAVYNVVREVLGTQTNYWAYFDPSEPPDASHEPVMGDLADDLADIYRDIKPGLRAWDTRLDSYLNTIIFDWKNGGFTSHWGVHAVSAMRALHPLTLLRGIQGRA